MPKRTSTTKNKPKPATRAHPASPRAGSRGKGRGAKTRKKTDRKSGAQAGNKNALKHGFYSKQFKAEERGRLAQTNNLDVDSEIALLRIFIDRLANQMPADFITKAGLMALNTLSLMVNSQSTLIRTHYLIRGKGSDAEKSILQALEELRLELGI